MRAVKTLIRMQVFKRTISESTHQNRGRLRGQQPFEFDPKAAVRPDGLPNGTPIQFQVFGFSKAPRCGAEEASNAALMEHEEAATVAARSSWRPIEVRHGVEGTMASYVTFNPPLDTSAPRIEIRDFFLGDSDGKGSDGRGYPGHMRRLWVTKVRNAIVHMAGPIPRHEADHRDTPQVAQIQAAVKNGTTFGTVVVYQPNRRVTMQLVKITRFTRFLNEPNAMMLSFQQMTEVST